MRPFLLFRPGGDVPEAIRSPLEKAGTEVLVAGTLVWPRLKPLGRIAGVRMKTFWNSYGPAAGWRP